MKVLRQFFTGNVKLLSLFVISVIIFLVYEFSVASQSFYSYRNGKAVTNILFYSKFYRWDWMGGAVRSQSFFSPAAERNCVMTSKRNYLRTIEEYDALVFFHWNVHGKLEDFPPQEKRPKDQLYILMLIESPQRSVNRSKINPYSHLFNLTMSYRLDADIVWPYGRVIDKATQGQVAPSKQPTWRPVDTSLQPTSGQLKSWREKTKMVSWVVSNCADDPSQRMKLAESLKKFIDVDIYGKCGMACDATCKKKLGEKYFFYLAFENSLATDYVSEKVFTMLGTGLIPIVYGGANYSRFLPPKSYINAQDFVSTEQLAEFLTRLSEDPDEYLSYFWWTKYYIATPGNTYADVCLRLKQIQMSGHVQTYQDLERWDNEGTWQNRTIEFS